MFQLQELLKSAARDNDQIIHLLYSLFRTEWSTVKKQYIQESLVNTRKARDRRVWMKTCFCHLNVVWRPLAEERLAISTQSIHRCIVHLVGYNSIADNTGLSSFVYRCYCLRNTRNVAKFKENLTLQQFKVIQGHRSRCQWKAHMWLPISH